MPPAVKERLDTLQLRLPGYDASVSVKGDRIHLTPDQTQQYEKLIIEQYQKILPRLLTHPGFVNLEPGRRQDLIEDVLGKAKKTARAEFIAKWQSKYPSQPVPGPDTELVPFSSDQGGRTPPFTPEPFQSTDPSNPFAPVEFPR